MYVMRAAQSKGLADLLALWPKVTAAEVVTRGSTSYVLSPLVWLVQCKRGTGRLAPVERKELVTVAKAAGAIPILAKTGPKGRGIIFINLNEEE